jgi:hypothetical protein
MQGSSVGEAFDGRDGSTLLHYRESQARVDAPTVYMDGARTALTQSTSLLGTGELQMVPKDVEQCRMTV